MGRAAWVLFIFGNCWCYGSEPRLVGHLALNESPFGLNFPSTVAINPAKNEVWVSGRQDILILDAATLNIKSKIATTEGSLQIAIGNYGKAYVLNMPSQILVFDSNSGSLLKNISLEDTVNYFFSIEIWADPHEDAFYILSCCGQGESWNDSLIKKFDGKTLQMVASFRLPSNNLGDTWHWWKSMQTDKTNFYIMRNEDNGDIINDLNPYEIYGKIYVLDKQNLALKEVITTTSSHEISGIVLAEDRGTLYATHGRSSQVTEIKKSESGWLISDFDGINLSPGAIALNANDGLLYTLNQWTNQITILDAFNRSFIKTLPNGNSPHDIAISTTLARAFVANYDSNDISVFDLQTNTLLDRISLGTHLPFDMAFDPVTHRAFISTGFSKGVVIWNPQTQQKEGYLPDSFQSPGDLVLFPELRKAFFNPVVFCGNQLNIHAFNLDVPVIQTVNEYLYSIAGIGGKPEHPTLLLSQQYIYDAAGTQLLVLNAEQGTITTNIPLGPSEDYPKDVDWNPAAQIAYVALYGAHEVARVDLAAYTAASQTKPKTKGIDLAAREAITRIPVGYYPLDIAVDTITNRVYISNYGSNSISVWDETSSQIIATIPVGQGPEGIAVQPLGNRIYVANSLDSTISVINGETLQVIATLPTQGNTRRIRIDPKTNLIYAMNYSNGTLSVFEDPHENDGIAPIIQHTPITGPVSEVTPVKIWAEVTDNQNVAMVTLTYWNLEESTYFTVPMQYVSGSLYEGEIPSDFLMSSQEIAYFIDATDDNGNGPPTGKTPGNLEAPNRFTVTTPIETPTAVYFEEITSHSITASAYSPSGFTGLNTGYSAINIAINDNYAGWHAGGNQWSDMAPIPTARGALAVTVARGKIFAIGGNNGLSGNPFRNENEEYDPSLNTWTTRAPMPTPRQQSAVSTVGEKIYVIGGTNSNKLNCIEEYDPITNTWTTRAPMPTNREGITSAALMEKIYVAGGWNGSYRLDKLEEYDPTSNTWTTRRPLPTGRTAAAVTAFQNKIYVIGGSTGAGMAGNRNENYEYDPAADAWATRAPMPTSRYNISAQSLGGKIYVVGGSNSDGPDTDQTEEYDPASNTWTTRAPISSLRSSVGLASVQARLYAIGGGIGSYNQRYDPGTLEIFSGLQPNTQYTFKAKARDRNGIETDETVLFSTYTLAAPPADVSITAVSSISIMVAWNANGNPAGTLYKTECWNTEGPIFRITTATSTEFTELKESTTYFLTIRSINGSGILMEPALISTITLSVISPISETPPEINPDISSTSETSLPISTQTTNEKNHVAPSAATSTNTSNVSMSTNTDGNDSVSSISTYTISTTVSTGTTSTPPVVSTETVTPPVVPTGTTNPPGVTPPKELASAKVTTPNSGQKIRGNAVTLMAATSLNTSAVQFQFRADANSRWTNISGLDTKLPHSVYWNTSGLVNGKYWLRAVAYIADGTPDDDPESIWVLLDDANADLTEDGNPEVNPNVEHRLVEKTKPNEIKKMAIADGTKAIVPPGAINLEDSLNIRIVKESIAPKLPSPNSSLKPAGEFRELKLDSGIKQFHVPITVSIPYADNNNDGFVDGTGIHEKDLKVYYFEESDSSWKPVNTSQIFTSPSMRMASSSSMVTLTAGKYVQTQVDRAAVFGLFASAPSGSASQAIAYPNPVIVPQGMRSITFDSLPSSGKIRIFTVSGRPVREVEFGNSQGKWNWNLTNDEGENAASGAYFYVVTDGQGGISRGKLAIIR